MAEASPSPHFSRWAGMPFVVISDTPRVPWVVLVAPPGLVDDALCLHRLAPIPGAHLGSRHRLSLPSEGLPAVEKNKDS